MSRIRDVVTLLGGRLAAQAVLVLTAPVLTRLFRPEDFGAVALLTAAALVLRLLVLLRYEVAIAQARDEAEAGALLGLCLVLGLAGTAGVAVMATAAAPSLARAFGSPDLAALAPLLPITVGAQALTSAASQWAAFRQRFGCIARAGLAQTTLQRLAPIPVGLAAGPSAAGLYLGHVLGQVVGALTAVGPLRADIRRHLTLDRARLREVASRHRNFPLHSTWVGLLDIVNLSAPAVVLGWSCSLAEVGLYGQAYALLNLPLSLFIEAASRVLHPHLAQVHHGRGGGAGALAAPVRRVLTLLADLGCYPFAAVLVAGPTLFELALGEAFGESGHLARRMVPMFLPWLLWSPLSVAANVLGRQRALLKQTALLTALRLGVLAGVPLAGGGLGATVGAWAAVSGAVMAGRLGWLLRVCGVAPREALGLVGARAAVAAVAVAPTAAALQLGLSPGWVLAALGLGGVGHAVAAMRMSPELASLVRRAGRRTAPVGR